MRIFVSAGEASGDLHAANLIKELRARTSGLEFFGLGGELMREQGVRLLYDLNKLAVTGFWEVARQINQFRKIYHHILDEIDKSEPELAILIDYPGMNLRLARELHRRAVKVVYYIAPQVWAWKSGRIKEIEANTDLLISILPFEVDLFDPVRLRCEFVGHPLLDLIEESDTGSDFRTEHGLAPDEKILAMLPGSRVNEVERHYPIMLRALKRLQSQGLEIMPFVAVRSELDPRLYQSIEQKCSLQIAHVDTQRYRLLKAADVSFVASGTATLEAALCGTPFCVVYRTAWLSYQIAKRVIKLSYVGLVNIVAGKAIAPEFLQYDLTPERLSAFAGEVLSGSSTATAMREELSKVRTKLGDRGAAARAAQLIKNHFRL